MKRVSVEVWSDFVCPWCWIAMRRLESASQALAGNVEVCITHKAYRLARGMAADDFKRALIKKLGYVLTAERMMEAVAEFGAMEGLTYNFPTMRFGDTTDAHILVKSAVSAEEKHRLTERIFSAATTEGLDIFDRDVLCSLAKDVGFSKAEIDFDDGDVIAQISRDEMAANHLANGVPLFVFNGIVHLSGAREVRAFERGLLQAACNAPVVVGDVDGASCGIDGCRI